MTNEKWKIEILAPPERLPSLPFGEFVVWIEPWQLLHVANSAADRHGYLRLLQHTAKVPGVAVFVGRLMIVSCVISLELFLAPFFRPAHIVVPFLQAD